MALSEAYARHPEHILSIDADPVSARVRIGEKTLARTDRALCLREGTYPPTLYFPRDDVDMARLRQIDHETHCPFKGDASYFDYAEESDSVPKVAWSYETPFDQMLAIQDYLAFYPDRVTIEFAAD